MCYIRGGMAEGGRIYSPGCSDTTLPQDDRAIEIPYRLYFAGESLMWNGGVCFISDKPQLCAIKARAYLVTEAQFWQILSQESKTVVPIQACDIAQLRAQGSVSVGAGKYDHAIYCGELEGYPMITFTAPAQHMVSAMPSEDYLRLIISGLQETHRMSLEDAVVYLGTKQGVAGYYSKTELLELSKSDVVFT